MAWKEVEREYATRQVDPVSFGVSSRWGAQVSLREAVIQQLGWKRPQSLRLYVDMDEKKIKLAASDAGQFRAGGLHKGGALVRLGVLDGLRTDRVRNMPVRYTVDGAELVVSIPAQLMNGYKPAAVAGTVPSTPKTPPAQSTIARKVDVTNRFFNDPKPHVAMASGLRGQR
jgi:hypothetical protein